MKIELKVCLPKIVILWVAFCQLVSIVRVLAVCGENLPKTDQFCQEKTPYSVHYGSSECINLFVTAIITIINSNFPWHVCGAWILLIIKKAHAHLKGVIL